MNKENAIPQNCRECTLSKNCQSWYGGTMCQHRDQIADKAIKSYHIKKERE